MMRTGRSGAGGAHGEKLMVHLAPFSTPGIARHPPSSRREVARGARRQTPPGGQPWHEGPQRPPRATSSSRHSLTSMRRKRGGASGSLRVVQLPAEGARTSSPGGGRRVPTRPHAEGRKASPVIPPEGADVAAYFGPDGPSGTPAPTKGVAMSPPAWRNQRLRGRRRHRRNPAWGRITRRTDRPVTSFEGPT